MDAAARAKRFADRFWKSADLTGECWLWTKCCAPNGYGQVWYEGKNDRAHRIAWILTYGPIPKGLFICHTCDVRHCINPEHLFLGTQSDNMIDAVTKGRAARYNKPHVQVDPAEVKRRYANGERQHTIAHDLGICQATVSLIVNDKRHWTRGQ
jgi:HNH endonuclease